MKSSIKTVISLVAFCMFGQLAQAGQLSDVKTHGTLVCGVLGAFAPFGFTDPSTRKVEGYDIDFCGAIAAHLGVKAQVKPLAIAARIPELQQGRVDILVAGLAYTPDRAKQIAFSDTYFVSEDYLLAKADKGFTAPKSLAGKRISVTDGGIVSSYVTQTVPDPAIVGFEDTPTAFAAMVQGKADAFVASEIVERRLLSKLGSAASEFKLVPPPIGREVWGIGVRKDAPDMLAAVNSALEAAEKSGEAQQIFNKWLGADTMYKMTRDFRAEPIAQ